MQQDDLRHQVGLLGADEWHVRNVAFMALQQEGRAAVEVLIAGTVHPNWRVRRGCADLMDHLADNRCVEPLLRLLHDPIEAVRRLALHALGCQGCKVCPLDVDIVAHLVRLAQADSSIRVRRVAVHQLGCQPPDRRAIEVLESLLGQETDSKLLSRARWALLQQQRPGD
jgi:HEAT repeat protein